MDTAERKLSGTTLFEGYVFSVELDRVRLPDGRDATREVVRHPGGVGVLAIDDEDGVWLVRQYRYAAGRHMLEIPAGRLERGESPEQAGRRELAEETGLRCQSIEPLGIVYPTPGYDTEIIHLFLARGLTAGICSPDDGEFVSAVRVPLAEAERMALGGNIDDAKTLAALLRLRLREKRT